MPHKVDSVDEQNVKHLQTVQTEMDKRSSKARVDQPFSALQKISDFLNIKKMTKAK